MVDENNEKECGQVDTGSKLVRVSYRKLGSLQGKRLTTEEEELSYYRNPLLGVQETGSRKYLACQSRIRYDEYLINLGL